MFNQIIRYYNQNRKKVITIVIVVIAVIVLIQVLNQIAKKQSEEKMENIQTSNVITTTQSNSKSANTLHTDSTISDTTISTQTAKQNQNIINSFIEYCNNGYIDSAYNLLSQSCKEALFTNIDEFKSKYLEKIFTSKKTYNIENWLSSDYGYTYKVTYIGDLLSTGSTIGNIEDYITVDKNEKLNILRYIANVNINKTGSNKIATITVIDKDVYDDYEIYNIKVANNSKNTIMLNRREDNDGIYVKYYESNAKYTAFITEIYENNLILDKNQEKYISIKINKLYNGNTSLKQIVFSDIINNKEQFDKLKDKNTYTDISTIQIIL